MSVPLLYSLAGIALFCIALRAVILATAPLRAILAVNVMSSGVFLVLVALANLLGFLLRFTVMLVAFWADNVWSLNVMLRFLSELLGGLMLPLSLFPQWAQDVLMWTPFPYLFYVPVMTLLGEVGAAEWAFGMLVTVVWTAVMAGVALAVWWRGRLSYTGVGI